MKGDPDGNLRLSDYVSRAECVKMVVAASPYKDTVATSLNISPFKDVTNAYWGAPYIAVGVSNKLVSGYPDGTFQPDGTVTFEEAATMFLKALGYTDADFGNSWPSGQVGLANSLSVTQNVAANVGDPMTRGDVAMMAYNTLNAKMKGSQQKLIGVFDSVLTENVTLIATSAEDSSVGSGKILTSIGTYNVGGNFDPSDVGKQGDLCVKNGTDFVAFMPKDQLVTQYSVTSTIGSDLVLDNNVLNLDANLLVYYGAKASTYSAVVALANPGDQFSLYTDLAGTIQYARLVSSGNTTTTALKGLDRNVVYSILGSVLVTYLNGQQSSLTINDSVTAYQNNNQKTVFGAIKSQIQMGDIIYVKYNSDGTIDYVSYEKGSVDGPYTVTSSDWSAGFAIGDGTSITRDGKKAAIGDIQTYDVVYFSGDLNMVLAYSAKKTGVYEKASPNKDMPQSITLSGVDYQIESADAFNKLCSSGQFNYGDTITVLFGRTNQIADVLSPGAMGANVVGYIQSTGTKQLTTPDNRQYVSYFAALALPDGSVYQYITSQDYGSSKNAVGRLTFSGGTASLSVTRSNPAVYGKFDWAAKTLGSSPLSSDVNILDVSTTDNTKTGASVKVFPQRIDGVTVTKGDVLYAAVNSQNQITDLILNNVTGDAYSYGIITKGQGASGATMGGLGPMAAASAYAYVIKGIPGFLSSSTTVYGVTAGAAARFSFNAQGAVETMQSIPMINGTISNVTQSSLTAGGATYQISDSVTVYKKSDIYTYTVIPITDVTGNSNYYLSAYYDKPSANGGRVRVIIASAR